MHDQNKIFFTVFILSACLISFLLGIFFHTNKIFPAPIIGKTIRNAPEILAGTKLHHVFKIRYADAGVITHDASQIGEGVTLLTGYWPETDWTPGAKLINSDGETLHFWNIDPAKIWPKSPYNDHAANAKNTISNYIHGSYLFPNGDLLFNVEFLGLSRVNACGEVVWRLPYRTHHSIHLAEDGNFWVSGTKWIESGNPRANDFPGIQIPFTEDTALLVSPDGDILKEISVLEALFNSEYKYLIWRNKLQFGYDVLHLNDIESLSSEFAPHFPMFSPGDLVVSVKYANTIFVMDQDGTIKWADTDSFIQQHDPDFESDGTISVFDNRSDESLAGENLGGSRITSLSPGSDESFQIYPQNKNQSFYTYAGGKHQRLGNGNRLITEARAGRVFETSPSGELVWEWIHEPYDQENVSEILEGTRYNYSQSSIEQWGCNN
jgi:hypothetical protein